MSYDVQLFIGILYKEQNDGPDGRTFFRPYGSVQLKYAHTPAKVTELTRQVDGAVDVFMYSPIVCNVDHQDETCKADRYADGLTAVPINHVIDHFAKLLEREKPGNAGENWTSTERTEKLHWLLKNFRSYYSGLELFVVPYGS